MKKIIFLFLFSIITGCAGLPENADFGKKPEPPTMLKVKKTFEMVLKDPDSAKYKIGDPVKGYIDNGWINEGVDWYGWWIPIYINSKNSYGGYTGFKQYALYYVEENGSNAWVAKYYYNGVGRGAISIE